MEHVTTGARDTTSGRNPEGGGSSFPPSRGWGPMPALLWGAFVIYGSLLPFELAPKPFDVAWQRFIEMPWLDIGPGGRADWLANLLLYVPLAFLWMGAWRGNRSPALQWIAAILVVSIAGTLAVSIEFLQVFFPPRTVSRNDLVAELLGTLIGIAAWLVAGARAHGLVANFSRGRGRALPAIGAAYSILYIGLALFPFDFLLESAELVQKAAGPQTGWWQATQACTRTLQCGAQLMVEALLAIPLGAIVMASRAVPARVAPLLSIGLLFGMGIEAAQFLLASGVSQGASVMAKAAGVVAGGVFAVHSQTIWMRWQGWQRRRSAVALLGVAYLCILAIWLGASVGVWRGDALPWPEALARLRTLHLLPLYNYYYTSETRALASALVQAALFAPPGILLALVAGSSRLANGSLTAGLVSGTLAIGVQATMLFHPPQRPDPTDVLIALAVGAAAHSLTLFFTRLLEQPMHDAAGATDPELSFQPDEGNDVGKVTPASTVRQASLVSRFCAAGLLLALGWAVIDYPLSRTLLCVALLAYAGVLVRWPYGWLVVLPAALPVADFTGYSGRIFWSEFDCAILLTLAVTCWRSPRTTDPRLQHRLPVLLALLLGVSILIALVRGLLPLEPIDANAFTNYHSQYNALRIVKGVAWAVLLVWLARREDMPDGDRAQLLAIGFSLGVAGVTAIVVWERFVFSGLLNFDHEYRVTGPFWEMNTGGAAIEGYLVSALPFVVYLLFAVRNAMSRTGALGVFAAGVYAVLVTMSRNGIVALAVALAVVCVGLLVHFVRMRNMAFKGLIGASVLVALAGAVALPIITGATLKTRFTQVDSDLQTRREHWNSALNLRDASWATELFGMGFGRFPEAFYWSGPGTRPASYRFMQEGGLQFLRLGGGKALYFEQFVPVDPDSRYVLSFLVRSDINGSSQSTAYSPQ